MDSGTWFPSLKKVAEFARSATPTATGSPTRFSITTATNSWCGRKKIETDGGLEVVSHYEAGRLVRRELLDVPTLAGRLPSAESGEATR